VIGMIRPGTKVEIEGSELLLERKLQGSNMGSNRFRIDMPRLVDFYLSGRLKLDELVSDRIDLDGVNGALENLRHGEVARQVVVFKS
jgi:S-(hydroxymethyl)glutathione dehydrogenase/alcohol dehydrogenase